jgi:epoxyqueuosine reductase
MPQESYPQSIHHEAKSVTVIGAPISLPVLEMSPSIYYHELCHTVNELLDQYTCRLTNFLIRRGHPSIFVPRDGYGSIKVPLDNPIAFFSHRHAVLLVGLGTFGVSNMILTSEYGPRVRFGSVLIAAKLPSDPLLEKKLCVRCMRCVDMCPINATYTAEMMPRYTKIRSISSSIIELGIMLGTMAANNEFDQYLVNTDFSQAQKK